MPTRHAPDLRAARVAERLQNDTERGMLFPGAERHLDPQTTPAGLADLDFVAKHADATVPQRPRPPERVGEFYTLAQFSRHPDVK
jgi:hypothetical protein